MKEKVKDNCLFQGAWYRAIKGLDEKQRLLCYDSFFGRLFEGAESGNPLINAITNPWLEQAEKEREAYFKACERKSEGRQRKWDELKDTTPTVAENPKGRFMLPTIDEVAAYCKERDNGIDAEHFVTFYTSKGWMMGSTPMKDWKAAVRAWEQNKKSDSQKAAPTPPPGVKLGYGEYIDPKDGMRHYAPARTVPMDAPPRPSQSHAWSDSQHKWVWDG